MPSPPIGSTVASAVLKLYSDQALNGSVVVTKGSNAWSESGTTYANAPTWDPTVLATSTRLLAHTYAAASLPLTAIPASGDVSFGLTTTPGLQAPIETRESANPPQLLVTYTVPQTPAPASSTSATSSPTTSAATSTQVSASTSAPATSSTSVTGAHGALIWSDDFDGAAGSLPNSTKWAQESGSAAYRNNELQCYTSGAASNASVNGAGDLRITVRKESNSCGRAYTSASLLTRGKFDFLHGYVEARIQTPAGSGLWPASGPRASVAAGPAMAKWT